MRGGRLCEVTEIATTGDKMPMEEVLSNTGWTSADAEQIFLLRIRPAMCGSGFTGAHRHHHLAHLVHLVVPLEQVEFGAVTNMEELMERTGGCCHHSAPSQFILSLAFDSPF